MGKEQQQVSRPPASYSPASGRCTQFRLSALCHPVHSAPPCLPQGSPPDIDHALHAILGTPNALLNVHHLLQGAGRASWQREAAPPAGHKPASPAARQLGTTATAANMHAVWYDGYPARGNTPCHSITAIPPAGARTCTATRRRTSRLVSGSYPAPSTASVAGSCRRKRAIQLQTAGRQAKESTHCQPQGAGMRLPEICSTHMQLPPCTHAGSKQASPAPLPSRPAHPLMPGKAWRRQAMASSSLSSTSNSA